MNKVFCRASAARKAHSLSPGPGSSDGAWLMPQGITAVPSKRGCCTAGGHRGGDHWVEEARGAAAVQHRSCCDGARPSGRGVGAGDAGPPGAAAGRGGRALPRAALAGHQGLRPRCAPPHSPRIHGQIQRFKALPQALLTRSMHVATLRRRKTLYLSTFCQKMQERQMGSQCSGRNYWMQSEI